MLGTRSVPGCQDPFLLGLLQCCASAGAQQPGRRRAAGATRARPLRGAGWPGRGATAPLRGGCGVTRGRRRPGAGARCRRAGAAGAGAGAGGRGALRRVTGARAQLLLRGATDGPRALAGAPGHGWAARSRRRSGRFADGAWARRAGPGRGGAAPAAGPGPGPGSAGARPPRAAAQVSGGPGAGGRGRGRRGSGAGRQRPPVAPALRTPVPRQPRPAWVGARAAVAAVRPVLRVSLLPAPPGSSLLFNNKTRTAAKPVPALWGRGV